MTDTDNKEAKRARKSRAFSRAKKQAAKLANNSEKLNTLAETAGNKLNHRLGALGDIKESLLAFLRLIKAWASGQYRTIPWNSLLLIIASVVYFVMPFDLVPDFIIALGLFDDVALLAWVAGQCKKDIDAFVAWENSGDQHSSH